jgi:hypothetical protein
VNTKQKREEGRTRRETSEGIFQEQEQERTTVLCSVFCGLWSFAVIVCSARNTWGLPFIFSALRLLFCFFSFSSSFFFPPFTPVGSFLLPRFLVDNIERLLPVRLGRTFPPKRHNSPTVSPPFEFDYARKPANYDVYRGNIVKGKISVWVSGYFCCIVQQQPYLMPFCILPQVCVCACLCATVSYRALSPSLSATIHTGACLASHRLFWVIACFHLCLVSR